MRSLLARLTLQEDLNLLVTNRIPRGLATRFVGWLSRVEDPLVFNLSLAIWKLFSSLDLSDAKDRNVYHLRQRDDLFESVDALREAIEVAFEPFLPRPAEP